MSQFSDCRPDAPFFILHEGPLEIRRQTMAVKGKGRIIFEWRPRPRFYFALEGETVVPDAPITEPLPPTHFLAWGLGSNRVTLRAPGLPRMSVAHLISWAIAAGPYDDLNYSGILDNDTMLGKPDQVTSVRFLLPNARNLCEKYYYDRPIRFGSGEWSITLTPVPNLEALCEVQDKSTGYAITYHGEISRPDNAQFSVKQSKYLMNALNCFLSFANARFTGPLLPQGFRDGQEVWQMWHAPHISEWGHPLSWYSPLASEALNELFPLFMEKWKDPFWQRIVYEGVSTYVDSFGHRNERDQRKNVIYLQTGLEMLARAVLVEEKKVVSDVAFEKGPMSKYIRRLFDELGIPIVSSERVNFEPLLKFAKKKTSVPEMMAYIRNLLVHPRPPEKYPRPWLEAVTSAKAAYTWFLELSLLRLLDFKGDYFNRLWGHGAFNNVAPEPVPWMPDNLIDPTLAKINVTVQIGRGKKPPGSSPV